MVKSRQTGNQVYTGNLVSADPPIRRFADSPIGRLANAVGWSDSPLDFARKRKCQSLGNDGSADFCHVV